MRGGHTDVPEPSENSNPNNKRRNPFKANDRIAFPPLDEALAYHPEKREGASAEDASEKEDPSESEVQTVMDLTIGMQSLIHPDSFREDENVTFTSEEEEDPEFPESWITDLKSPEQPSKGPLLRCQVSLTLMMPCRRNLPMLGRNSHEALLP